MSAGVSIAGWKLGQAILKGERRVILERNGKISVLGASGPNPAPKTTLEIVSDCKGLTALSKKINQLVDQHGVEEVDAKNLQILKAIDAPEVWAVGVTYKRQAAEHDADIEKKMGRTEQLYYYVYKNKRAEVFFKGFARTCSGPGEPLFLRTDSEQVLPESEMVLLLGTDGMPIAYTIGNDMTAWDIERECPLYLNQAKIWDRSGSIGPFLVPADQAGDPYRHEFRCRVVRRGEVVVDSKGSTSDMKRSIEELCYYLNFNNTPPAGTLLFTGTACVIPHDFALEEGDVVDVISDKLGTLSNPIVRAKKPAWDYQSRD